MLSVETWKMIIIITTTLWLHREKLFWTQRCENAYAKNNVYYCIVKHAKTHRHAHAVLHKVLYRCFYWEEIKLWCSAKISDINRIVLLSSQLLISLSKLFLSCQKLFPAFSLSTYTYIYFHSLLFSSLREKMIFWKIVSEKN